MEYASINIIQIRSTLRVKLKNYYNVFCELLAYRGSPEFEIVQF